MSGRLIEIPRSEVVQVWKAAASQSGQSSPARDLALLLDRGLRGGRTLSLRRAEAETFARIATEIRMDEVGAEFISRPTPEAANDDSSSHPGEPGRHG